MYAWTAGPQVTILAFVERLPADHPLRTIKAVADEVLARLSPEFDRMHAEGWTAVHPSRALAEGVAAACPLPSKEQERLL